MPSESGCVFSLKMRMALFMRARSIALRTWSGLGSGSGSGLGVGVGLGLGLGLVDRVTHRARVREEWHLLTHRHVLGQRLARAGRHLVLELAAHDLADVGQLVRRVVGELDVVAWSGFGFGFGYGVGFGFGFGFRFGFGLGLEDSMWLPMRELRPGMLL